MILFFTNEVPRDDLSLGTSISTETEKIDNYLNVYEYPYNFKTKKKEELSVYALKDRQFSFAKYQFDLDLFPQGICFTDKFLFITAYSKIEQMHGELKVYDKDSGEYLLTLCMDEDSHLGGIAFDGENVWVCNSANQTIERISYDFVCLLAEQNKGETLNICHLVSEYKTENIPSCITFYNGRLWIATHKILFSSEMVSYYYSKEMDTLQSLSSYTIPPRVQGITFGNDGRVYLSTSYGRRSSSYLLVYKSIFRLINSTTNYYEVIEMPPCSEALAIYDNDLYVIFESATDYVREGYDGKGVSLSPLDKILIIEDIE